jgi:hypothetical protein
MKAIILILVVLSVVLLACSSTDAIAESAPEYPDMFPANIPLYSESELTSIRESMTDTSTDYSLQLLTEDSVADVNTWYRGALQSNGWTITSDRVIAGYTIIQGENGNLFTSMQAARGAEGTVISQQVKVRE